MSEESEAEKIKLEDDLKKVLRQLRLVLRIYDPDKYEVDILVVNKDDWIKKVVMTVYLRFVFIFRRQNYGQQLILKN